MPSCWEQVLGLLAFGTGWNGALAGGLRIPEADSKDDAAKQVWLHERASFWLAQEGAGVASLSPCVASPSKQQRGAPLCVTVVGAAAQAALWRSSWRFWPFRSSSRKVINVKKKTQKTKENHRKRKRI